ncbi:MAG: sigma-54-dependent Fis family transcriptional regulator [Acidobacteria bacterium]|nr:sigma-54-dependent Fis family transcriptional regulator [Candidatus Atribacteria bacterium]MBE3125569.1 sigma-54-dependent Fis family transcriptional regulator [Acidobacteriota bacterium]
METILIVDDDKDIRFNLSAILRGAGYEVRTASNGRQAIKEVARCAPSIALLDFRLPDMDGIKVLEGIRKIDQALLAIMVTAYGDVKGAIRAMKMGAVDYIAKPFDEEELILIIKKALETRSLSQEVKRLRNRLGESHDVEEIMGRSPRIQQILRQVEIIAPTNMTVVIQGASGTGKELIARRIHHLSRRRDQPFVAVDCGALPETLMESEFFGYEKGAFTGADGRKDGWFEQAHGGTLFLDEITNLSEAVQMKLLRVLQERRLRHLGGQREISIDVRILVASNFLLLEQVRQRRFRDDLYHRLNEFQIALPRLAERMEDIPILAKSFLEEANSEFHKDVKGFSPEAMKGILNHAWPGNVREFKNVTRRAVLLAESDTIELGHLSMNPLLSANEAIEAAKPPEKGASFEEITRNFQKDVIKKALEEAGGKKAKAAELLKLNKKTLYRKLKSLNI